MTRPTILDLFCGAAGGWSLGMHRAGFTTVAACEIDPWRRAMFAANFPDARMYDDVRTIGADRLVSELGALPDVIVGSPPCQDASSANTKGKGVDGERTKLFFEAIRIVRECRPRWVAFENVPGIRNRGVDRLLGGLEEIGYATEPCVVGADDIGANHARKRVWFLAFDPAQVGRECGRPWRRWAHGDGSTHPEQGVDAADAPRDRRSRRWGGDGRGLDVSVPEGDRSAAFGIGVARDAESDGRGPGRPGRRAEPVAGVSIEARRHGPDADEERGRGVDSSARDGREPESGDVPDADGVRELDGAEYAEMGGSARVGDDAEQPWADWNCGLAYHIRMDDGLSARMAATSGVRGRGGVGSRRIVSGNPTGPAIASKIVAAYGDAVVPQIPELIGRSIWRVERALAAIGMQP